MRDKLSTLAPCGETQASSSTLSVPCSCAHCPSAEKEYHTIFLRLSDVASGLPPYEERVLLSRMDSEPDHTGLSQRSAYEMLYEALKSALGAALATGSKRLLATYLQTLRAPRYAA